MEPGLNDRSAAYMTQWIALDLLMSSNNPGAVSSDPEFLLYYTSKWLMHMAAANAYVTKANASTAGITDSKNTAKDNASTSGSTMGGKGVSYAIRVSNDEMKGLMRKYTFNKLRNGTNDPDLGGVIKSINDYLLPFVTSDPINTPRYFTATTLTAMMSVKSIYTGKLGKYKLALKAIDNAKTDLETIQIPVMEEDILYFEGFLNDLMVAFPDFVKAFRAILKKLDILGKRNQGVDVAMVIAAPVSNEVDAEIVEDEPMGLGGMMAVIGYPIVKKAKVGKTNSMGVFAMMNLKIGIWMIKFSCPGYVTQMIKVTVTSKRIVHLVVRMVPIAS